MKIVRAFKHVSVLEMTSDRNHFTKHGLHLNSLGKEVLSLPSQYIFSLLMFMIRNRSQFLANSEIHHINTRQHANFHQPSVNVAKYQKGVYYLGVKVFNALPSDLKTEFNNPKKFKVVLPNSSVTTKNSVRRL